VPWGRKKGGRNRSREVIGQEKAERILRQINRQARADRKQAAR
jgi:hypothetical protein